LLLFVVDVVVVVAAVIDVIVAAVMNVVIDIMNEIVCRIVKLTSDFCAHPQLESSHSRLLLLLMLLLLLVLLCMSKSLFLRSMPAPQRQSKPLSPLMLALFVKCLCKLPSIR
jgi:hypothetical protein